MRKRVNGERERFVKLCKKGKTIYDRYGKHIKYIIDFLINLILISSSNFLIFLLDVALPDMLNE